MKIFSGFVWFASGYRSAIGFVISLTVLALSAGCGQKAEQPSSAVQQTGTPQPAANGSTAAISSSTDNSAAPGEPDLTALNRAVRKWMIANRAVPKSFDDFVARAGVPIPPPPPGKKYVLNQNMHVELVNQ